jgi:hypothetical protein
MTDNWGYRHTNSDNVILYAFPWQQRLCKYVMSCYTYSDCLVLLYFCPSSKPIFHSLAHQMQWKSHYISIGTEFLLQCYLYYRWSLTLESVHQIIPSWWTNISSYEWVNGTIFQDCFSLYIVPDVGQQCRRNNLSFKTVLVWTTLLNTHNH